MTEVNYKPTPQEVEEEHYNDIKNGQLEPILWKLEEKGSKLNIAAYKEMQTLRAKRNKKVQDKLEEFGPAKSIIDSSQVAGALVILKFMRLRRARIAAAQAKEASKSVTGPCYNTSISQQPLLSPKSEHSSVTIDDGTKMNV